MANNTSKARVGAKGAVAMVRHPRLRRATVRAATPPAKLGWRVGKVVVKRKARAQFEQVAAAGRTVSSYAVIYGPMTAELFGIAGPPKPRRRAPAFVAGVVVGGCLVYVVSRGSGA